MAISPLRQGIKINSKMFFFRLIQAELHKVRYSWAEIPLNSLRYTCTLLQTT